MLSCSSVPFFWSLNVLQLGDFFGGFAANYSQAGRVTALTRRIWRKVLLGLPRSWATRYEKGDARRIGDGIFPQPISSLAQCNVNSPPVLLCRGRADLPPWQVPSWPLACHRSFGPLDVPELSGLWETSAQQSERRWGGIDPPAAVEHVCIPRDSRPCPVCSLARGKRIWALPAAPMEHGGSSLSSLGFACSSEGEGARAERSLAFQPLFFFPSEMIWRFSFYKFNLGPNSP